MAAEVLAHPLRAATEVCNEVFNRIPHIAPHVRDATLSSTAANYTLIFGTIHEGSAPDRVPFAPASASFARECARSGLSLSDMIGLGSTGGEVLNRQCQTGIQRHCGDPDLLVDSLTAVSSFVLRYLNRLYAHWGQEFVDETDHAVRGQLAARLETVRAILESTQPVPGNAGAILGLDLASSHRALLAWNETDPDIDALQRRVYTIAQTLDLSPPLMVPRGGSAVAAWISGAPASRTDLPEQFAELAAEAPGLRMAFGEPHRAAAGFRRSYEEAAEAQRVARLAADRDAPMVRYRDAALTALLTANLEHARRFVVDELGGLSAPDEITTRLAETLAIYLEHRDSPRRTAEVLFVHENTVKYRVRQAQQILGRDLTSRRTELEAALRLLPLLRSRDTDELRGLTSRSHSHPRRIT